MKRQDTVLFKNNSVMHKILIFVQIKDFLWFSHKYTPSMKTGAFPAKLSSLPTCVQSLHNSTCTKPSKNLSWESERPSFVFTCIFWMFRSKRFFRTSSTATILSQCLASSLRKLLRRTKMEIATASIISLRLPTR